MKKKIALIALTLAWSLASARLMVILETFAAASDMIKMPQVAPNKPVRVKTAGRGKKYANFSDGIDVNTRYAGEPQAEQALARNLAEPLALASADFDEDGVADLVSGYRSPTGGILTVHRGNVDAIYPNSPDAQQCKAAGDFIDSPFLSPAQLFVLSVAPDFLVTGDFDADGHTDILAAERGGDAQYLMAGDGHGRFAEARRVELGGRLTTLTAGEINRPDGLTDIVAGVVAPDGPEALVFESPAGAMRGEPERIKLPAEPTALALGQFDNDYAVDLVVGAGSEVLLVRGRDRKLSLDEAHRLDVPQATIRRQTFPFTISAMARVDLRGESRSGLALLSESGRLRLLKCAKADGPLSGDSSTWQTTDEISVTESTRLLISAHTSGQASGDLIVMDSANHQLQLLASLPEASGDSPVTLASSRTGASTPQHLTVRASLDVASEPMAVLPIRLNPDALNDLVILRSGVVSPSVVQTAAAATITVNDTADTNFRDSVLTLREAILLANGTLVVNSLTADEQAQVSGTPAAGQLDAIAFNIPGTSVHTISIASALPTITDAVIIDGTTQPGFAGAPLIELHGNGSGNSDGLTITGGNSTVRALVINNFTGGSAQPVALVLKTNGNNVIEGNYLGTNATGDAPTPNAAGISVTTSNNTIGGTTAAARNVISGNTGGGIKIQQGSPATPFDGNKVLGNYIGTNAAGTAALNNGIGQVGVIITSSNNTIGGTVAGARNVITGYSDDVEISNGSTAAMMNLIQGNYIGTDLTGAVSIGSNTAGVLILGSGAQTSNNTIGGTSRAARNIIAVTTGGAGAEVSISSSSGNTVQGNTIGTNADGTVALGIAQTGVQVSNSANTTIGGTASGAGNLIAGRSSAGVAAQGNSTGVIQGNFIGTNAAGTGAIPNAQGVSLAANLLIGGPALSGAGNIISANGQGITISVNSAVVQGNLIGTQADGISPLGNSGAGITIRTSDNVIGGTNPGEGNVIAFNGAVGGGAAGIAVNAGTDNSIRRNSIYANGAPGHENVNRGINFGGNQFLRCNDHCDGDSGTNNFQNFPALTTAVSDGSSTTITGSLDSTANTSFAIEFFSNTTQSTITACNPAISFSLSQGQNYLGSTTVTTDGACSAAFNVTLPTAPSGQFITATATNLSTGDTSEFSACVQATGPTCAITCPTNQTASTGAGSPQCGAVVNYPAPVTTGTCGAVTCTPSSGSLFAVGATTVTCAASAGPSCSFTVTVTDDTPPTIACPANVSAGNDAGLCSAVVNYSATTTDNCSGASVACSPPSGSTFAKGTTQVNCTAIDAAGNTARCGFTVTVNDTQAPTIACPANVTSATDTGQCSAVVSYALPTATDNCAGAVLIICSPASGTAFAKGVNTVNCTATDVSGSVGVCSFIVTVNDTTRPSISCPSNVVASAPPGQQSAVVSYTAPNVVDNCLDATGACTPPSGSRFPLGTSTVNCVATDRAGNQAACSFTVTVNLSEQGSRIAFDSNRDGNREIYIMNADGTSQTRLTFNSAPGLLSDDLDPAISPDGTKIAFTSYRDGNYEIYVMNADGSNPMRLSSNCEFDGNPTWSPDGTRIAFTGQGALSSLTSHFEIFVMNADGSNRAQLTTSRSVVENNAHPVWSPDGNQLAFVSTRDSNSTTADNQEIYVMNAADGSNQRRLTNSPGFDGDPAWSPDGGQIAFTSSRNGRYRIWVMTAGGSNNPRRLTDPGALAADAHPAWSPDGAKIAFDSNRDGDYEIYKVDASSLAPEPAVTKITDNTAVDFNPSWRLSIVPSSFAPTISGQLRDHTGHALSGVTVAAEKNGLSNSFRATDANGNYSFANLSAGASYKITPQPSPSSGPGVSEFDPVSRTFRNLLGNVSADFTGSLDPQVNGQIAFVSRRDGQPEIYVMNADGSNQTKVTVSPANDTQPDWASRDFSRSELAFVSDRDGNREIYTVLQNGTGVLRVTNDPADDFAPAWFNNGFESKIAFTRNQGANAEIYVVDADGSHLRRLTNNPGFDGEPDWSPDGTKIVFSSQRQGNQNIYVLNARDGTILSQVTTGPAIDAEPAWSPDGRKIAFASRQGLNGGINVMNADGSNLTALTSNIGFGFFDSHPTWSPDSQKIAFTRSDGEHSNVFVMDADGSCLTNLTAGTMSDSSPSWSTAMISRGATQPSAGLAITRMEANPNPVIAGRHLIYNIRVTNYGPAGATNVVLLDLLPKLSGSDAPAVNLVSVTGIQGTFSLSGNQLTCNLGTINAETSADVTLDVVPLERGSNSVDYLLNEATVGSPDINNLFRDAQASITTAVNPSTGADIAIKRIEGAPNPVIVGRNLTYRIEVINYGADAASGVLLTNLLPRSHGPGPPAWTFVSASATQGTCTRIVDRVDCDLGTIASLASAFVSIIVIPNEPTIFGVSAQGVTALVGSGSAADPQADVNRNNNTSTTSVTVLPSSGAELSVRISDNPDPVILGRNVTYTIQIDNRGAEAATNVVVADNLSGARAGEQPVVFVSASPSQGICSIAGNRVLCNLGTLASQATATVTIIVQATQPTIFPTSLALVNSALVSSDPIDLVRENNTAAIGTTVFPSLPTGM
jgi:uncharacterized repeat protein (TIGR01451 family)